jgi:hypothetical protein
MKFQRVAFVVTFVNLALLTFVLIQNDSVEAQSGASLPDGRGREIKDAAAATYQPGTVVPVLRGRALELVDERGRVRAEIKVLPADPTVKMPDGTTGYPETVLLRLIDSEGAPNVKIAATENGSGISLGGESNPTHVQVLARGTNTSLTLVNQDGRKQVITPE